MEFDAAVLESRPFGFWPLEEGSSFNDMSPRGAHLSGAAKPDLGRAVCAGRKAGLTGLRSLSRVDSRFSNYKVNIFSVGFWVATGDGGDEISVESASAFSLKVKSAATAEFYVEGSSGTLTIDSPLKQVGIHFVLGVYSPGNASLYVDGKLAASSTVDVGDISFSSTFQLSLDEDYVVNNLMLFHSALTAGQAEKFYSLGTKGIPIKSTITGYGPSSFIDATQHSGFAYIDEGGEVPTAGDFFNASYDSDGNLVVDSANLSGNWEPEDFLGADPTGFCGFVLSNADNKAALDTFPSGHTSFAAYGPSSSMITGNLSSGDWNKTNATASSTSVVGPDGSTFVSAYEVNTTNNFAALNHYVSNASSKIGVHTFYCVVKEEQGTGYFRIETGANEYAVFSLLGSGSVVDTGSDVLGDIQPLGNDWFLVCIAGYVDELSLPSANDMKMGNCTAGGSFSYQGSDSYAYYVSLVGAPHVADVGKPYPHPVNSKKWRYSIDRGALSAEKGAIEFWVQDPFYRAGESRGLFFNFGSSTSALADNAFFFERRDASSDEFRFVYNVDGEQKAYINGNATISQDSVSHVAVTWDRSSGIKMYVDGVEVGSEDFSFGGSPLINEAYLFSDGDFDGDNYLDSSVVAFRIHKRPLSAQEISDAVSDIRPSSDCTLFSDFTEDNPLANPCNVGYRQVNIDTFDVGIISSVSATSSGSGIVEFASDGGVGSTEVADLIGTNSDSVAIRQIVYGSATSKDLKAYFYGASPVIKDAVGELDASGTPEFSSISDRPGAGRSLSFRGSIEDRVDVSDAYNAISGSPHSVVIVCRPQDTTSNKAVFSVNNAASEEFSVMVNGGDFHIESGTTTSSGPASYSKTDWKLIVVTYDGTKYSAYLDGDAFNSTITAAPTGSNLVLLGARRNTTSSVQDALWGDIASVAMIPRVLTSDEIASMAGNFNRYGSYGTVIDADTTASVSDKSYKAYAYPWQTLKG